MTIITIINFFASLLGCIITILSGILFLRHRQLIEYFKNAFTFIDNDYQPEISVEYDNLINEVIEIVKYGIRTIGKSDSNNFYGTDKKIEINRILVVVGKLLIASGIVAIVSTFIGFIWMLVTNHNVNISLH